MIDRGERLRLLLQPIDQGESVDLRIAGNVVDRLLRIECGALTARNIERIDAMALHLQHAALEDGENADRTGTDDDDVGTDGRA